MSASLARFLKDFSAPAAPPTGFDLSSDVSTDFGLDDFPLEPEEPPVDIEAERNAAYAEGHAAAQAEALARHQEQLAELQAAHASELETMKAGFEMEIASMSVRFEAMRQNLSEQFSAAAVNVLLPLVDEIIARKAVEGLAQQVREAFSGEDGIAVVVHGPETLTSGLVFALKEQGFNVTHRDAAGPDVTVEHGDMVFATRLAAWIDGVRELLK